MSLDKVQSKEGLVAFGAIVTAAGLPGGIDFCFGSGFAAGSGSATDGGGAMYFRPMPQDALVQTLINAATIVHNGAGVVYLNQAAAVTGIIMQAGIRDGQHLVLVNTNASNSITFNATPATSLVASTTEVIAVNRATLMVWNAVTSRWHRVNV
jgi:hypothetical protein